MGVNGEGGGEVQGGERGFELEPEGPTFLL